MKQASYAAKTDHLRRMMDMTKNGLGWRTKQWTWRWILLTLGCWTWWASVVLQAVWHAAGAAQADDITEYDFTNDERIGWRRCILPVQTGWMVKGECQAQFTSFVEWSLIAALLSFWWNPKLKEKMRGPYVRLTGLTDHFWFQALVITFRVVFWQLMRNSKPTSFPPQVYRANHAVMAVFMLFTTITSLRTVQVDKRPRKLFDDNIQPLISESERQQQDKPDFRPQSAHAGTFPLHKLDPKNWLDEPLTPPPDEDTESEAGSITASTVTSIDSNRMDWEPTVSDSRFRLSVNRPNNSFAQQQREQPYQSQSTAPSALGGPSNRASPFFGTLPAQPKGITPKGRQVVRPAPFIAPNEEKKQNFFAQVMSNSVSGTAPNASAPARKEFSLERPRLPDNFARDQQDTGLEDLFDRVLVSEEPPEVRQTRGKVVEDQEAHLKRRNNLRKRALICIIPLALGILAVYVKVTGLFDGQIWPWPIAIPKF